MLHWLKRSFWLLNLLTIALCAAFLARAAARALEGRYFPASSTRWQASVRPTLVRGDRPKNTEVILRRNLFCSTCPPLVDVMAPDAGVGLVEPQKSALPLVLVTTLIADDPAWSIAILRDRNSRRSGAFKVASALPGQGVVDLIEEKRVYLRMPDGHLEYLDLLERMPPTTAAVAVAGAPDATADAALDGGIKKVGDNRFTLQRALVDRVLSDTTMLARSARITPSVVNGRANGFRVFAIRPNSLYARIGIQNGDTVQSINGHEMTSPDRALEVFTRLRSASHLVISLLRGGKIVSFDYTITSG